MAKKKRKPKKLPVSPIAAATPEKSSSVFNAALAQRLLRPRALSTFAFGISGLLAGLCTGLNHFPALENTAPLAKMILLASFLGDPHLDYASGFSTALAGLMIGGTLGFSALSNPREMGISLLLSVMFAIISFTATGSVLLAGVAFLAGHLPVFLAWHRLRTAS